MKNLKVRKYFNIGRRFVFSLALFVLVFAAASIVKIQAAGNVTGWLWGGTEEISDGNPNNGLSGYETGVGWISMNNSNQGGSVDYGVNIPSTNDPVTGYAWANAGGNPDNGLQNGLGWIQFDPSSPYPTTGCGGACPNYSTRRNGNILEGWARIVGIKTEFEKVPPNSGGWEGWIKMSGSNYGVEISKMLGVGSGSHTYAWSNELGWIDFGQAATCTNPSCSTYSLCEGAKLTSCNPTTFCSNDLDATCTITGDTLWTCSNGCGSVSCSAIIQPRVDGTCATTDSFCQARTLTKDTLCSSGNPNPDASSININTYQTNWQCQGICGGSNTDCSAQGTKACGWIETNP